MGHTAGTPLLTIADVRRIEAAALELHPDGQLMERAARAVARAADRRLRDRPAELPAVLLVGPGNNGADALLAGLMLHELGYPVHALLSTPEVLSATPPAPAGDAGDIASSGAVPTTSPLQRFAAMWQALADTSPGVVIEASTTLADDRIDSCLAGAGVVIDGLFGIGLSRPLTGQAARLVAACARTLDGTASSPATLAIDVASGLDADRGAVFGALAFRADLTVTMIADKPGLHTGQGIEYSGTVEVAELAIGELAIVDRPDATGRLLRDCPAPGFAPRRPDTHKGTYGTLLIAGGGSGMAGAALLAAGGAQAAGVGKLAICSPDGPVFDAGQPQWMTREWGSWGAMRPDAVVVGCGLGHGPRALDGLRQLLASDLPLVIDADALVMIAQDRALLSSLRERKAATVLTPHPLEAARLLGRSTTDVQRDRIAAARDLVALTGAVVVLKGAGSVIADPHGWSILAVGGPTLATAGTGDVLAGLTGALLAQGHAGADAARLAAWAHGRAGDLVLSELPSAIGLAAGELPFFIRRVINQPDIAIPVPKRR